MSRTEPCRQDVSSVALGEDGRDAVAHAEAAIAARNAVDQDTTNPGRLVNISSRHLHALGNGIDAGVSALILNDLETITDDATGQSVLHIIARLTLPGGKSVPFSDDSWQALTPH